MKKSLAALTAAFYLYGFTFCLCYAAATGQVHPAVPAYSFSPAPDEPEPGECHHRDRGNQAEPSHHPAASEPCCIKFLQETPGLLAGAPPSLQLLSGSAPHFLPVSALDPNLRRDFFCCRNHGPPGPIPQTLFPSALGSRAPPA
jgi:hypothetical protein